MGVCLDPCRASNSTPLVHVLVVAGGSAYQRFALSGRCCDDYGSRHFRRIFLNFTPRQHRSSQTLRLCSMDPSSHRLYARLLFERRSSSAAGRSIRHSVEKTAYCSDSCARRRVLYCPYLTLLDRTRRFYKFDSVYGVEYFSAFGLCRDGFAYLDDSTDSGAAEGYSDLTPSGAC